MKTVNIHDAKTHLSKLIAEVETGEEIVIARGGTPVARLVPLAQSRPKREFGALKGRIEITKAFFEPMSEDEVSPWE